MYSLTAISTTATDSTKIAKMLKQNAQGCSEPNNIDLLTPKRSIKNPKRRPTPGANVAF